MKSLLILSRMKPVSSKWRFNEEISKDITILQTLLKHKHGKINMKIS